MKILNRSVTTGIQDFPLSISLRLSEENIAIIRVVKEIFPSFSHNFSQFPSQVYWYYKTITPWHYHSSIENKFTNVLTIV